MELNKNPTCPFNKHMPCVPSCMFAIGYFPANNKIFYWIGCKLEPKENNILLDPDNALIHIAEMLEVIAKK